jgi:hypothetical protein
MFKDLTGELRKLDSLSKTYEAYIDAVGTPLDCLHLFMGMFVKLTGRI